MSLFTRKEADLLALLIIKKERVNNELFVRNTVKNMLFSELLMRVKSGACISEVFVPVIGRSVIR